MGSPKGCVQPTVLSSSIIGIIAFNSYYTLRSRYSYEPHLQMGETERFDNLAKVTQGDMAVVGQGVGFS